MKGKADGGNRSEDSAKETCEYVSWMKGHSGSKTRKLAATKIGE